MLVGHVRRREIGGGRLVPLAFAGLALLGCERNPSPIDGGPPSADSSGDAGVALGQAPVDPAEAARWAGRAAAVTIIRDTWGIPHVYGKTDADAVFGMIYAQAEDDFGRVENNYLTALGMLAQVEGEAAIWKDLRARLYVSPEALERLYSESPPWLRELMDGWADGLNFFLYTHPDIKPRLLRRFEPWMALAFSEGSIGGDIEQIDLDELAQFYGAARPRVRKSNTRGRREEEGDPSGSNGIAIAPRKSVSGNALLLINPHTSFFFRAEQHVVSEQGLDVYGAATWGQFFIYQGFNEDAGWMHTSSGADAVDWYLETVVDRDGTPHARNGDQLEPLAVSKVTIPYASYGAIVSREFTVYHSQHGPIVAERDGKWVAFSMMQRPIDALAQSFSRNKARNHAEFHATMQLRANSTNNTVFADSNGNIAYYHGNFIPRRDPSFDWSEPVDGSNPKTAWGAPHELSEMIAVLNPPIGWVQNTNNWPFTVAGPDSPKNEDFVAYMAPELENPRGIHALRILENAPPMTLDTLLEAAYDAHLSAFEDLLPGLFAAYDALPQRTPLRAELADPIVLLRSWDLHSSVESIETSLAIYWGEALRSQIEPETDLAGDELYAAMIHQSSDTQRLAALRTAMARLKADFGDWRTPWGTINRYQRIDGQIRQPFSDTEPSLPVPFGPGRWGALASYSAVPAHGTKRRYGTSGNSFVAVVEFGERVRARAITVGGESGDPKSKHFDDQVQRYLAGDLREVWFYREDVEAHAERTYNPGKPGE